MHDFIVLEGLDGSGKGTQTKRLVDHLTENGQKVRRLDLPNYDSDSSFAVKMYLDGRMGSDPYSVNAYAASSFFAIDRYISYMTDWKKDFNDPETTVIANRYTTANAYHQMSKMDEKEWDGFLKWLWDYEYCKLGLPKPQKTILLNVYPEFSMKLIEKRCRETGRKKDIHETNLDYLRKSYKAALYVAKKWGWHIIDCIDDDELLPVETIFDRIIKYLKV